MRPSLVPIRNCGDNSHGLANDEEPQHMLSGVFGSESSAEPGAKNRDHNEEGCTRDESAIRGRMASDEVSWK